MCEDALPIVLATITLHVKKVCTTFEQTRGGRLNTFVC